MSSIQERLQMKRVPLDTWSTQEKLCLASSVVRSGDQNWMSVSRALRSLGDPNRPPDWFSQKNCAAQYGTMLENVETPRRKKRVGEGVTETPQESIVKKLTQQRIQELQKEMAETARTFAKIKEEVKELTSESVTESRVRELNTALENTKRERERGAARRAQWLREREQRRGLLERAWRRAEGAAAPLLTSLLQSPTHHHNSALEVGSPSAGAPTLSLLLEKTTNPLPVTSTEPPMLLPISDKVVSKSELLKIEQIKSELQEFEQQFRDASNSESLSNIPPLQNVPPPELMPTKESPQTEKTPEKIEIDDIEIKAEDVYAFSDIDLDIPPVSSIHKSSHSRTLHSDKNLFNKRELTGSVASLDEVSSPSGADSGTDVLNSLLSPMNVNENSNTEVPPGENILPNPPTPPPEPENQTEAVLPDSVVPKEDSNDKPDSEETEPVESLNDETIKMELDTDVTSEPTVPEDEDSSDGEMNQKVADIKKDLDAKRSHEDLAERSENSEMEEEVSPRDENLDETSNMEIETMESSEILESKDSNTDNPSTDQHQPVETHTETDDDTPIEVIKEMNPGKTKRDYSRKKTEKEEAAESPAEMEGVVSNKSEYSDEIGSDNSQGSTDKKSLSRRFRNEVSGSRSESPATPLDSLPGSPAPSTPPPPGTSAPEPDKEYRTWKKAILLAYSRLNTLKYASIFTKPISDDLAPGYSQVVKKPMDLSTIRKNIDMGVIRTTKDFRRDVLLMMNNALMYNRSDHRVHLMTRETLAEIHTQLNILLQAQGHLTHGTPLSRLARPSHPHLSRSAPPPQRRKRGGGETPTPI